MKAIIALSILSIFILFSCSKDDKDLDNKSIGAFVNGNNFSMAQSEGISSAVSNGSLQINAINSENRGFQFFLVVPDYFSTGAAERLRSR